MTSISMYLAVLKADHQSKWMDFNFYGHQLVCHEVKELINKNSNDVDGNNIPVPHFGIILDWDQFHKA